MWLSSLRAHRCAHRVLGKRLSRVDAQRRDATARQRSHARQRTSRCAPRTIPRRCAAVTTHSAALDGAIEQEAHAEYATLRDDAARRADDDAAR